MIDKADLQLVIIGGAIIGSGIGVIAGIVYIVVSTAKWAWGG